MSATDDTICPRGYGGAGLRATIRASIGVVVRADTYVAQVPLR
jgi:hypothetical protein